MCAHSPIICRSGFLTVRIHDGVDLCFQSSSVVIPKCRENIDIEYNFLLMQDEGEALSKQQKIGLDSLKVVQISLPTTGLRTPASRPRMIRNTAPWPLGHTHIRMLRNETYLVSLCVKSSLDLSEK